MNRAVHDAAREWLSAGRIGVVVEVVDFKGSVPRESGTRMLVASDAVVGTIGGGHLELQAIEDARTMLAGAARSSRTNATSRWGPRSASAAAACCDCAGRRCQRPRCRRGRRPTRAFICSCTAPATSAAPSRACWLASTAACSGSTSATASFRPSASAAAHRARVRRTGRSRGGCGAAWRVLSRADAQPRARSAHHRGDSSPRRLRLPRAHRFGHQARALRAPLRRTRHRR